MTNKEREAVEIAKSVMRCGTCAHARPTAYPYPFSGTLCTLIQPCTSRSCWGKGLYVDPELFGCVMWRPRE